MFAMIILALGAAETGRYLAKKLGWTKPLQWIWSAVLFTIFLGILIVC
jgi:hypothetical protein